MSHVLAPLPELKLMPGQHPPFCSPQAQCAHVLALIIINITILPPALCRPSLEQITGYKKLVAQEAEKAKKSVRNARQKVGG